MISSKHNQNYKFWMKLKQKKYRDKENKFLVYGPHLVEEALKAGAVVEIITSNEKIDGTLISRELMKELNVTETPYEIMALCRKIDKVIDSSKILVLEDVQDPDNIGALIRSASAFGFNHLILSNKCADIYNEKVIRTSKGAIFHVSYEKGSIYDKIKALKNEGYHIYATDVYGNSSSRLNDKAVLILGNEGQGVSSKIKALATTNLLIKTKNVESLNVAIAGSILMYEWSRL